MMTTSSIAGSSRVQTSFVLRCPTRRHKSFAAESRVRRLLRLAREKREFSVSAVVRLAHNV
jgi:hypothetical protein